jgi:gliding motility-associated-like protein
MANAATEILNITAKVNASGNYTNTASVAGDENDPDGTDDSDFVSTNPTGNSDPVANDDTNAITEEELSITGNLLTNDSDADSDVLSVSACGSETDETVDVAGIFGTLDWNSEGSYTFSLDNSNATVQALNNGETLTETFSYSITDGNEGTASANLIITINGKDEVVLNTDPVAVKDSISMLETDEASSGNLLTNDSDADGDTIIVSALNGFTNADEAVLGEYGNLVWETNGDFVFTLDNDNEDVNGLMDDEYLVETFSYQLSDNKNGYSTATLKITIIGVSQITPIVVSDGFSPNGDGVNDAFEIENIEDYPNNELIVYNRWGTIVFDMKNYDNTWDGKSSITEKILPVGTYFYVLILEDEDDTIKGYVYLKY